MTDYFTGPCAAYHILCDYCDDTIRLETMFRNQTEVKDVVGNARAVV